MTNEDSPRAELDTPSSSQAGRGRFVVIGIFLAFLGLLAIGLFRQNLFSQRAAGAAPDFEFTTFEGETISLADLKGKGVVLNFWASWCDPCRAEAELLETSWRNEETKGEIVFIGLDYLDQEHSALDYLAEFDVTYPNGPDLQSRIARRYRIKGVPETFFIRPDGSISTTIIGPILSEADFNRRLDDIRP
ncbi:MAG: TlpA disulfide reductase family protein [Chloroflexota bacterium]